MSHVPATAVRYSPVEVLIIGRRLREQISRGQGADDAFEKAAIAEGMLSIKADGIEKPKKVSPSGRGYEGSVDGG